MPHAAHDFVFKLDNAAGTLTDYSAVITELNSGGITRNTGNYHVFGTPGELHTQGGYSGKFSIKYLRNSTIDLVIQSWVRGVTKTFELYEPSTAAGSEKVSGECMLLSRSDLMAGKAGAGDTRMVTAEIIIDGNATEAQVST